MKKISDMTPDEYLAHIEQAKAITTSRPPKPPKREHQGYSIEQIRAEVRAKLSRQAST